MLFWFQPMDFAVSRLLSVVAKILRIFGVRIWFVVDMIYLIKNISQISFIRITVFIRFFLWLNFWIFCPFCEWVKYYLGNSCSQWNHIHYLSNYICWMNSTFLPNFRYNKYYLLLIHTVMIHTYVTKISCWLFCVAEFSCWNFHMKCSWTLMFWGEYECWLA